MRLHLPTSHRVTVEQVLLFLIREGMVKPIHDNWAADLNQGHLGFERDFLRSVLDESGRYSMLPFPIGVTRRLVDMHSNAHSRFTSALDCMESLLKYCCVLLVADCYYANLIPADVVRDFFITPKSDGVWQNQLERALAVLGSTQGHSIAKEIAGFYSKRNKKRFSRLINVRNKKHRHGATHLSEKQYEDDFRECIEDLDSLIRDFEGLSVGPLILVVQTDVKKDGLVYDVMQIMGDNVIFPHDQVVSGELRLSRGLLYQLDKDGIEAIELAPFLIFERYPYCGVEETFFLEEHHGKKGQYHTYRGNHRIPVEDPAGWDMPK